MARDGSADEPRRRHYSHEGSYERRQARRREREQGDADDMGRGHWWCLPGEEAVSALWGWAERLRQRQRRLALLDTLWEAIYRDAPVGSLDGGYTTIALRSGEARENIACSLVNTVVARLAKRRPFPVISPDDGGYAQKLFAKRASRVLRRKLGTPAIERMRPDVYRDAVIRGDGATKVYRDGGDVAVERIPRRELVVDPRDARYGAPRTLAQVKTHDRSVLCAMFPDAHERIEAAARASYDDWTFRDAEYSEADLVDVIEAWRLPSARGADDGRHIIAIRGGDPLLDEPWCRPRFPVQMLHWDPPIEGWFGHGLVEQIAPIQAEVNQLLGKMARGITEGMALKVFAPAGSVDKQHLKADFPAIVEVHGGAPPQYIAPLPFNPAVLQYIQWRIQQAYELSGISQAGAASKNPLGANASGKALDTMYDLESDRFSDKELAIAMWMCDVGVAVLDEARAIAEDRDVQKSERAAWINEVDWRRVELDDGSYHLAIEPVNFLPDSRAGKLSHVAELAQAGLLTSPLETAALFDEPDIARANRHRLGPYRMIERWLEDLADLAVPIEELTPTPLMVAHLDLAKEMATGELCNAVAEDAEDEIQERYRWALTMLDAEAQLAQQPGAQPAAPADAAMPPAGPGDAAAGGVPPGMPPADAIQAIGALAAQQPPIDPLGGLTSQLAAGMPAPAGMEIG